MDDDERARLLERAYGPDADIAADPAAAARLRELQAVPTVEPDVEVPAPSSPIAETAPPARRSPPPKVGRPPRAQRIAIAAVAIAGLVLGGVAAARTAADLAPVVVVELSGNPGAPGFLVDASNQAPPNFPISEDMQWSAPLGTVLGWDVWVGRSRSNFACLAVLRSATMHADCVTPADFDASGTTVYLPPGDVATDLRPAELTGDAALAFRWQPDRSVVVEVDR